VALRFAQLSIVILVLAAGCTNFPRDPKKTLEHVRSSHTLKVGAGEDPPFLTRHGEEAEGRDADLVRGFAQQLGAKVEWEWGSQEEQFESLEQFHLDLVAGGVSKKSPWVKKVAITRPFAEMTKRKRSFAVPPGENAFLKALETYLAEKQ